MDDTILQSAWCTDKFDNKRCGNWAVFLHKQILEIYRRGYHSNQQHATVARLYNFSTTKPYNKSSHSIVINKTSTIIGNIEHFVQYRPIHVDTWYFTEISAKEFSSWWCLTALRMNKHDVRTSYCIGLWIFSARQHSTLYAIAIRPSICLSVTRVDQLSWS